jgi:hypothetical protein
MRVPKLKTQALLRNSKLRQHRHANKNPHDFDTAGGTIAPHALASSPDNNLSGHAEDTSYATRPTCVHSFLPKHHVGAKLDSPFQFALRD